MKEKRIQFNSIIQNQLPSYVREEFPLVAEFLKQYYISQEFQGSATDLIQNIDQYIKLNNINDNVEFVELESDISISDDIITVSSPTGTEGFPNSYGLLLIDSEVITYTGKTSNSFTGCIRGFSGITSYDEFVFTTSQSQNHTSGSVITNLSYLFLQEFFNKIKYQITPGFEKRDFYSGLDKYLFLKQSKDFYSTRGTETSFKILFNSLYGEDVKIIKPQDYLIKPSYSQYNISNVLVVESISGDPYELENSTLKQNPYGNIEGGYAPIARVEKIFSQSNKVYYKLSFDSGYNKDIRVDGSLYGNFSIHPKTKIIGNVLQNSTTIDVDSTVGFPSSGELSVIYSNGISGVINYSSKNLNQFFGCTNVNYSIDDSSDIYLNVYAEGTSNLDQNKTIKVRVCSVVSGIDIKNDNYYQSKNDTAIIKSLGSDFDDVFTRNWFYNRALSFDIVSAESRGNKKYKITTRINQNLKIGDSITIFFNNGTSENTFVELIESENVFITSINSSNIDVNIIRRNLLKVNNSLLSNQIANVQNTYRLEDKTLISSPSIPYYDSENLQFFDRSITIEQKTFEKESSVFEIGEHYFYTGDSVYYIPGSSVKLMDEGVYFIVRIDSNGSPSNLGSSTKVKFAKSKESIFKFLKDSTYTDGFISVGKNNDITISNDRITDFAFLNEKVESQKILREIKPPINDGNEHQTDPGTVGILINGVEILNYKSKNNIYYGSVEKIDVVNSGSGYDIINPPELVITDSVGTGATGYCAVNGSLREIRIVDPGFDYLEVPKINIFGGNGSGAKASALMKLIDHQVLFNSEQKSAIVNIASNTIGLTTYHKFRNAEKVIYKTQGETAIGGISTNSLYYVSVQDLHTIKFHKTYDDAISGINTISLTSYGTGNHILQSYDKKSIISSISVEDGGINYENKKRTVFPVGINTSLGHIEIKNHNFSSGEIVNYSTTGSPIGGLTNNTNYYVTKVNSDIFKLSQTNTNGVKDFYYQTNQYINLTSSGIGTHIFNYPEIIVEVDGKTGVSSIFNATIQPIFRGEITSVYIESGGVGYGSSDIINFNRVPNITLENGSNAQLIPIINNGRITQVLITNPGQNYNSPPNLTIQTNGSGVGAVLTPIVKNGSISEVKIIESGAGYDKNNTFIIVNSSGSAAEFSISLKRWTLNLFSEFKDYFLSSNDDGFIFKNLNSKYGLQYAHVYAPRKLRKNLFSIDSDGSVIYGKNDLVVQNGNEVSSDEHSPIIGWAYDGNPIYGPYGYSKKDGGTITRMKSGYMLIEETSDRPPYPEGFFVEDYEYKNNSDDSVLDEHNGRYCITPDFPNGVYAYFATIEDSASDSFDGYNLPEFPYIIGNKFKSIPNEFNFKSSSNQDDIDLNSTKWSRTTNNYNLLVDGNSYPYLFLPNYLNQTVDVKYSDVGKVENIDIVFGGNQYKVNDKILFDNTGTGGFGVSSKISKVKGKIVTSVGSSTTTISNVEIYPYQGNINIFTCKSNEPHNLSNSDFISISGLNTSFAPLTKKFFKISIPQNNLFLSENISNSSTTGIVTYISVSGNISQQNLVENDIYVIGSERVKILNVDLRSSRVRILREVDGTVGASHTYGETLYSDPRRFNINIDIEKNHQYSYRENKELYFYPQESLGIGTDISVGAGITISFSNPGLGDTQVFVPTKSIYLPDHNLKTGDSITYFTNGGTPISVSIDGSISYSLSNQSILYVAKLSNDFIGVSTVKVGLSSAGTFVGIGSTVASSTTLYLTNTGTGEYHSFRTNYNSIIGEVRKNVVTVSTAQTHGLTNNDYVFFEANPGTSKTFVIKYDDYNRKIVIDPRSFESSDVDSELNTITIPDHKLQTGQKVSYASTQPIGDLVNNETYSVVVYNKDKIKLSTSLYNATIDIPVTIGIASTANGTISPINPPLEVYKNSSITFDVSDPSLSYINGSTQYSAFELNFYKDPEFKDSFETSKLLSVFDIQRSGRVGIETNAKVSLSINEITPQTIFYKLDPVYTGDVALPKEKEEVNVDKEVNNNNKINVRLSVYNGKHQITSISSTSFTYNILETPESSSYNSESSQLNYSTSSLSAFGSISDVEIISSGQNYRSLPKISSIVSRNGSDAILELSSKSIGKIKKTKINDIGFDFSSDFTVRPNYIFPQVLRIEPLNSLDFVGVSSVGRGYVYPPKLLVLDGKTNQIIPEIELKYSLEDSKVSILNNTYRLNNTKPTIIPTRNSNGVGISSISYNPSTYEATVTLSVGFSTASAFPFEVDDEVLIEGTSVGLNSTGKGFNSKDYNYKLFTITSVDANIGGFGSISYNLKEFLNPGEEPGTYDIENSLGRVIPKKYFPSFNITLKSNRFFLGEEVKYFGESESLGIVENWDENSKQLKISSRTIFNSGNQIEGVSSKTQGVVGFSTYFTAFSFLAPFSKVEDGWNTRTGFLNNDFQKIQDNFYYQNFSYSLKSRVPYDTWEEVVGSLNHTAGFKKFSDYQLESYQYCGISTDSISNIDITIDIDGFANLNCVYNFDLAKENAIEIDNNIGSDEIIFSSRILQDYYESVSNRVLNIDDFSNLFNSNPRFDRFSVISRFPLSDARAKKYITYVEDRRYSSQNQIMVSTLLHDNTVGYINQYARVESTSDLGTFDFDIDGTDGVFKFYPVKYTVNDYNISFLSYNVKDNFVGVGSTSLGGIVVIDTETVSVSSGTTTISSIDTSHTSSKILVEIVGDNGNYDFNEISVIHDGTNVEFIDYGELNSGVGLGTYNAYISGSNLNIDFTPTVGVAATISTIQVSIANTFTSGIGTFDLRYCKLEAKSTAIASSISPITNIISEYSDNYNGGYFIVQVSDTTNNRHQLSEVVVVNNDNDAYYTEYGNLYTHVGLGTIGVIKNPSSIQLTFTPIPSISAEVKVYSNILTDFDITNSLTEYHQKTLETGYGIYYGTNSSISRSFELKHEGLPIFKRYFDASDTSTVSIASSTITIPNHFFVTGEKVSYSYEIPNVPGSYEPIGIASTDFGTGIGVTNKLPGIVYVIKVNENTISLSRSAEDALKATPIPLKFTSVGIGTSHSFTSFKQNSKSLIAIDNVIQSPIVSTSTTTLLSSDFLTINDVLYCDSTYNLFVGDLIQINNEIMKIEAIGIGTTNSVKVFRPLLGTNLQNHNIGTSVTKIAGNYNIVENTINFADAPYGNVPIGTTTNPPDEQDWFGVSTRSSFQGRVFMRSGIEDSSNESYYKNVIFDDISSQFDGSSQEFTVTSNQSNVTDVYEDNAIILINDIFQSPGLTNNYTLNESVGVTSITFVGTATSLTSDINTSNLPAGKIIVSVGSTPGFGYQPLVAAGGTAIVSIAGTISSISIGNSGSGYRQSRQSSVGIEPIVVRVGVATSSVGIPNIEFIGTAAVSNGNIVSIAITNPGTGYTSTNPPTVIIDEPLSYSDIPLIYTSSSSGIGTEARVDIVVGQGSSVISFELTNTGYGYNVGDILTVPTGGPSGIPTTPNSTIDEFEITVDRTITDKFSGWTVGELQIFDNIQRLFNGRRVVFPLVYLGELTSIYAKKGSAINIQDTLLVFINDILQVPGEGYIFNGGSRIIFTEAPKPEDTCKIIFYKGSGDDIDVIFKEVIETVKPGDELTLTYNPDFGQEPYLIEDPRLVTEILSIDIAKTLPYFGPGNTSDETLEKPVIWCRQTDDRIINETIVGKDRIHYEPLVNPVSYLISNVGIGTSIIYVDNLRPLFNAQNEASVSSLEFQKNITLISQDILVSASATAIVSSAGTVSSIVINDGGIGYVSPPEVSIQAPSGITTITTTATSSITAGIVTSISITGVVTGYSQVNPPSVLVEPPSISIESNKVISYTGDSGIIVGIGTTTGISSEQLIVDLFIPLNSSMRQTSLVGSAVTISSLSIGDFFILYNSNVGLGTTYRTSVGLDSSVLGISTSYVDNVYQVSNAQTISTNVAGVGVTYVRRIFTNVVGLGTVLSGTISTSNYFGNYSWGKIELKSRSKEISYNSNVGIGTSITSSTIVRRSSPLKYINPII